MPLTLQVEFQDGPEPEMPKFANIGEVRLIHNRVFTPPSGHLPIVPFYDKYSLWICTGSAPQATGTNTVFWREIPFGAELLGTTERINTIADIQSVSLDGLGNRGSAI